MANNPHQSSTAVAQPQLATSIRNLGWRVTLAGLGINLALGVLYSWSVIKDEAIKTYGWNEQQISWAFSVACLVFAVVMVPAGLMQDRLGPRLTATLGGLLLGTGLILTSMTDSLTGYIVYFGVLAGAGIGFGYASATPPAVKWFPPKRTGLIAGIVVAGFGLAGVYAGPLTDLLIKHYTLPVALKILGGAFLVIVVVLAQLLAAPPKGYIAGGTPAPASGPAKPATQSFRPIAMLATWQFWLLWFMYFCGPGAGLMIISTLKKIGTNQTKLTPGAAATLVATMSIGNGAGRVIAGAISDRIGRKATLFIFLLAQAVAFLVLSRATAGSPLAGYAVIALIAALIGANYGANLSLFPSLTKDFYGLKNFGINYGLVFTAWGVGSLLAPMAGKIYDKTKSYEQAYYVAAGLLVVAALAACALRAPRQDPSPAGS